MIDFNIIVNAASPGVSKAGFGRIAVLATDIDLEYSILKGMDDLPEEIDKESESYDLIRTLFSQTPQPRELVVLGKAEGDATEVLEELLKQTDDFFFIVTNKMTVDLAKSVETLEKVLFGTARDVALVESINKAGLTKTAVVYHEEAYAGEALAVVMSYDVGEKTAHFKTLSAIPASEISNEDAQKVLDAKGNLYVNKKGRDQISGGTMIDGQWIDVLLGAFWIKFTLDDRVNYLAANTKKIPYNNTGVGMLAGVVGSVMAGAIEKQIINSFNIDYKDTREISAAEKATRVYDYLVATGNLTGAIHGGDITINLQYEEAVE